jgi:metal-responsive CopG/Arc/MetJ family transcriptional regulator
MRKATFKLGPMEIELLRRVKECGVSKSEAVREAIRNYVPYLLEQCERQRRP